MSALSLRDYRKNAPSRKKVELVAFYTGCDCPTQGSLKTGPDSQTEVTSIDAVLKEKLVHGASRKTVAYFIAVYVFMSCFTHDRVK